MAEDFELLHLYAEENSEDAFAEIVRRHINLVYSVALRCVGGDAHLAADVTQSVFTDLARKAAALARRPVLGGWLYRSTQFAASDVVRAERRRRGREMEAQKMQELTASPAEEIDWHQLAPALDDVMTGLSARDRDAVVLRFFEGRAYSEIGARLQLTTDAARRRVDRALEKIRALLAKRGITSTAAALALMLANQTVIAAPAGLSAAVTAKAFASVATAVGPALGFLQLMSTTKATIGIAGILVLFSLVVATREVVAVREAGTALATAKRNLAALLTQTSDVAAQVRIAEHDRARLDQTLADARAARAAPAIQPPQKTAESWDPEKEGDAFLARHPEVKQALVDYYRAKRIFTFGPLFASLRLTAAQIEQCQNLFLEAGNQFSRPLPTNGKLVVLRFGDGASMNRIEDRLRALLGEEGYRQRQEFGRTLTARTFAAQVAGALIFTDSPLTPPQSEQLVQIIAGSRVSSGELSRSQFDWDRVIDHARGILTASQLDALSGMRAQDQFQQAWSRGAPSPVPPK